MYQGLYWNERMFNTLKTESIFLRKFQKVIELAQKLKDFKNNGTNIMGFQ
jgi:hypothetical protein